MSALLQCSPKFTNAFNIFLFSQSQFDHLRYDSPTLALSQKTARKSSRSGSHNFRLWTEKNYNFGLCLHVFLLKHVTRCAPTWRKLIMRRHVKTIYPFIAHSLPTQGFPVIVGFMYWFSLHCVKMATSYLSRNMMTTRFRHYDTQVKFIQIGWNSFRGLSKDTRRHCEYAFKFCSE